MEFVWHEFVGSIGVILILIAYAMLQLGRLEATSLTYSLLNWAGPALVLASLFQEFNLAAAVLEVAWLLIATVGLVTWFMRRRESATVNVAVATSGEVR